MTRQTSLTKLVMLRLKLSLILFNHRNQLTMSMADREGFEPSVVFQLHTISNRAHSTTLAPVRESFSERGGCA